MPTYSYVCDACGHGFERFQSMNDDPVTVCPSCGKQHVRRLIGGGTGLIFKGSGFYATDYARKSEPGSKAKEGSKKETNGQSPSNGQKPSSGQNPSSGKRSPSGSDDN